MISQPPNLETTWTYLSHNQSPVLQWSTQNHVKNQEAGYPQPFLAGTAPY